MKKNILFLLLGVWIVVLGLIINGCGGATTDTTTTTVATTTTTSSATTTTASGTTTSTASTTSTTVAGGTSASSLSSNFQDSMRVLAQNWSANVNTKSDKDKAVTTHLNAEGVSGLLSAGLHPQGVGASAVPTGCPSTFQLFMIIGPEGGGFVITGEVNASGEARVERTAYTGVIPNPVEGSFPTTLQFTTVMSVEILTSEEVRAVSGEGYRSTQSYDFVDGVNDWPFGSDVYGYDEPRNLNALVYNDQAVVTYEGVFTGWDPVTVITDINGYYTDRGTNPDGSSYVVSSNPEDGSYTMFITWESGNHCDGGGYTYVQDATGWMNSYEYIDGELALVTTSLYTAEVGSPVMWSQEILTYYSGGAATNSETTLLEVDAGGTPTFAFTSDDFASASATTSTETTANQVEETTVVTVVSATAATAEVTMVSTYETGTSFYGNFNPTAETQVVIEQTDPDGNDVTITLNFQEEDESSVVAAGTVEDADDGTAIATCTLSNAGQVVVTFTGSGEGVNKDEGDTETFYINQNGGIEEGG